MIWGIVRSFFSFPPPMYYPIDINGPTITQWSDNYKDRFEKISEIKIVTFNMLAPCYKRLPVPELEKRSLDAARRSSLREASKDFIWKERARRSLDFFHSEIFGADIIALQEFWLEEDYAALFHQEITKQGYHFQALQRSFSKTDAVALLIKSNLFDIIKTKNIVLSRFGDRVALLLWLRHRHSQEDIMIANTHLSFPHNEFDRANQIEQIKTLTEAIDDFVAVNAVSQGVRVVLGDFNVVSASPVCEHLRRSGYSSCLEISAPVNNTDDEVITVNNFISHRTHRKEDLGVDHIFVRRDVHHEGEKKEVLEQNKDLSIFVTNSEIIPQNLACSTWNESFTISDHRPVGSSLIFSKKKIV